MIAFSLLQRKLTNLNTGNVYYDSDIANSINAIGEKKRLEFTYETDVYTSIAGYNFYINLAMFIEKGSINPLTGKGEIYWMGRIPDTISVGTIQCAFFANGTALFRETYRNYNVQIEVIDSSTFKVIVDFYQTLDVQGYMTGQIGVNNKDRLRLDRYSNGTELSVSGKSIYNGSTHEGRIYLYAERNDDPTDYGKLESEWGGYTARFYGGYPGTYGNAPSVSLSYWVGSQQVDRLNTNENTKVLVTINSPDYEPLLFVSMYKLNVNDNTLDFVENYDMDSASISALSPPTGKLATPFTQPTSVGVGVYEASFYVAASEIDIGSEYSFNLIIYDQSGTLPSSFDKKAPSPGSGLPYNGNGFNSIMSLIDYEDEYFGNQLECVVEERIASRLLVMFGGFQYSNDIYNRLGIIVPNNILLFLKVIRFRIYEELTQAVVPGNPPSAIVNYFVERELVRAPGKPDGFTKHNEMTFTSGPGFIYLQSDWRNRYEDNVNCIRSTIDGIDYGNPLSSQDWGGKSLKIDWEFEFYYDTISSPFMDIVKFTQKLSVKDYQSDVQIETIDPTKNAFTTFCNNDALEFKAIFDEDPFTEVYKLITTIEPNTGNIATIEESEMWTEAYFPQQFSNKILSQEENFGQTINDVAKFTLDGSQLSQTTYKVSAIAKKQK